MGTAMPPDVIYDPSSYRARRWDLVSGLAFYGMLLIGAIGLG